MPKQCQVNFNWSSITRFGIVSLMCMGTTAANAEDIASASAAKGYELSKKLCRGCHLIDDDPAGTARVGPPSFRSIANQPGQTAGRVRNVLIQPHRPMPDLHLSNQEILNIIGYLETLRTDKTAPPLLSPAGTDRPRKPARS